MSFENFSLLKNFKDKEELYKLNQTLLRLVSEQSFFNNTDVKVSVSFSLADTDVQIKHDLGRIPTGYVVFRTSQATAIYDGTTAWDSTYIYLKSATAGTTAVIAVF